ncbi:Crp/Fnr family transcriptional regulator [Varunaivibrio sulfuroxidans]|uniref:CRP-like cAMP-binding protein n=1 Tax=Varunaivibrio sulfuroxidans TaxID=1773489 RepID=A0A4R3J9Y3_9PROT|nr:cyclic nucleotide-binding domain-containing protein [Varunaivibrio sulfuroxidans]TCS61783.1 CRP-like cAMP-binding protein [Varunaivibrio sulfuroxidans]WES32034.1 cyclic nucleotide-binding domain-containing protein [Varunaivibrio sulfuroxidans]
MNAAHLSLLRQVPLFSSIPPVRLEDLLRDAALHEERCGTVLFLQGEPASHFYAVLSGWIKLYRQTSGGDEAVIEVLTSGESFAEAAIFESSVYPVSAETVSNVRFLAVPAAPFVREIENDNALAMHMLASMSRRLRAHVLAIEQLSVKTSSQRLGEFLLRLSRSDADSEVLHLPYDKMLVAGRLGMKPETLSRAFAKLREIGIASNGTKVVIKDRVALQRYCEYMLDDNTIETYHAEARRPS